MNFPLTAEPLAGLQKFVSALARDREAGWPITRQRAAEGFSCLLEMASPRGRCNRRAFLVAALSFLAIQTCLAAVLWLLEVDVGTTGTLLMNAPILWIGTTICIKRLHDTGRRGWWLPAAFIAWAGTAFAAILIVTILIGAPERGEPSFVAAFAAVTLPVFAALLWLHTRSSEPRGNMFGPVPTGFGLSLPAPKSAPARSRTYYASAVLA